MRCFVCCKWVDDHATCLSLRGITADRFKKGDLGTVALLNGMTFQSNRYGMILKATIAIHNAFVAA